jgi:hypothetical protein
MAVTSTRMRAPTCRKCPAAEHPPSLPEHSLSSHPADPDPGRLALLCRLQVPPRGAPPGDGQDVRRRPPQAAVVRVRAGISPRARKAKTPHSHLLAPPSSPNPLCRYQKFTLNFRDSAEFRRCLLDDYLKVRMMGEEASPLQAQIRRSLTPPLPKPHTPPPRRPPSPTRPPARRAPSAPSSGRRTAPTGPPRSGPSTSPCTTSRTSPP